MVAVDIVDVSKKFKLWEHGRPGSLKERVVNRSDSKPSDFWALKNVSFEVPEGVAIGILGHNGSGKSTLLKCVAGVLRPNSGSIKVKGRVAALLELGSGFHPELTGVENIYLNGSILGFSKSDMDARMEAIVDFAAIDPRFLNVSLKRYSSGMGARLGFAVAVQLDPEVLVLDEVLAVGDESFQDKCLTKMIEMRDEGRTIVLVTHNAAVVSEFCSVAAVIDHGSLVAFGEPVVAIKEFRERLSQMGELLPEAISSIPVKTDTREVVVDHVNVSYPAGYELMTPGSPLNITVRMVASHPVDDVILALSIIDRKGRILLSTNTELLGAPLGTISGTQKITLELGEVPLRTGIYDVSVGLHSASSVVEYHRAGGVASFRVIDHSGQSGIVDMKAAVRPG